MEPRGPTSHMATAMEPVHGSQSSFGSTDVTLTAQRGAVLMSSYGSESMGEVSKGTASTAFTSPKGAKVYPASRRRSNKRVGLKRQLAPHCVP